MGRFNRGKKQLRFDEAERFITMAFELFDERQDVMALAAVTALLLGCHASEVLQVRVRDLDRGGTRLWIAARDSDYRGKTAHAVRDPAVPEVLRPRLLRLSSDQAPDAYLFGLSSTGKPKSRHLLHSNVRELCKVAGVPVVCPHGLRGVWATAGVHSGGAVARRDGGAGAWLICCDGQALRPARSAGGNPDPAVGTGHRR